MGEDSRMAGPGKDMRMKGESEGFGMEEEIARVKEGGKRFWNWENGRHSRRW